MTRADAEEWAVNAELDLVFADGFDDAIVGIGQRFNTHFVVYDVDKVIAKLIKRDGMTRDDALEFFDFNIVGAWVGGKLGPPCFVTRKL